MLEIDRSQNLLDDVQTENFVCFPHLRNILGKADESILRG